MCAAYKRLSIFCAVCWRRVLCIGLMQARQQQQFGKEQPEEQRQGQGQEQGQEQRQRQDQKDDGLRH